MPYGEEYKSEEYDRDLIPTTIPAGIYRARIVDVNKERVEKNGAPMASVRFMITTGEYEGQGLFRRYPLPIVDDECAAKGGLTDAQKMNYNRFLAPFLDAIGAPAEGLSPDKWIGEECWIRVETEDYEGAETSKITGIANDPAKIKAPKA